MSQGIGDIALAYQCFRLALVANNDHAEAYNNLGVLEMRKGHTEQVHIMTTDTRCGAQVSRSVLAFVLSFHADREIAAALICCA